jgi:hypothetical protein
LLRNGARREILCNTVANGKKRQESVRCGQAG